MSQASVLLQQEVTTQTTRHVLRADGVVVSSPRSGVDSPQTLEDARQNVEAIRSLCRNVRRPLLLDLRTVKYQSREVRDFYMRPESSAHLTAIAMLSGNALSRAFINVFLQHRQTTVPMQLFSSEHQALEWLKQFVL